MTKKNIAGFQTETQSTLSRLQSEIEKTLEKIASREKYINTQFEGQIEEYKAIQSHMSEHKQKYNVAQSRVNELTNELSRISEELDTVKVRDFKFLQIQVSNG